jgi:hypothetical protein
MQASVITASAKAGGLGMVRRRIGDLAASTRARQREKIASSVAEELRSRID